MKTTSGLCKFISFVFWTATIIGTALFASHAWANTEITCSEVVNQVAVSLPVGTKHTANSQIEMKSELLTGKVIAGLRASDPEMAQYETFKIFAAEFQKLVSDSQKALAYFYDDSGANDLNSEVSSIGSDSETIQENANKLRKLDRPSFIRDFFFLTEPARVKKIAKLIAEIQLCNGRTKACSIELEKKIVPLKQHLRDVKTLRDDMKEAGAIIKGTLASLSVRGLSEAELRSITNASEGLTSEFAMTSTLLEAHLKNIGQQIELASVSLQTVRSLPPLLAGAVAVGASPEILKERSEVTPPSRGNSEETATGVSSENAIERIDALKLKAEAAWQGASSSNELPKTKPILEEINRISSMEATYALIELLKFPSLQETIYKMLYERITTDEAGPRVYRAIQTNEYGVAIALLVTNPSPTATLTLLEYLASPQSSALSPYLIRAVIANLPTRSFENSSLPFLQKIASGPLDSDITWAVIDVIAKVPSPDSLKLLEEIRRTLGKRPFAETYRQKLNVLVAQVEERLASAQMEVK